MDSPSQIFFPTPIFLLFVFLVSSSKRGKTSPSGPSAYEHHFNSFVMFRSLEKPYIHSIRTSIQVTMWQSLMNTLQFPQVLLPWERDPISLLLVIFCSYCFFSSIFPGTKLVSKCGCWKPAETNRQLKWQRSFGRRRPWDKAAEPWQFSAVDLHMSTWAWQPGKTYLPLKWHSPFFGKKSSNHPVLGATVSLKEGHPQSTFGAGVWWFISTIKSKTRRNKKHTLTTRTGFIGGVFRTSRF